MGRGSTLGECLTALRVELRLSLNAAHNIQVRDTQVKVLQQTQEWLYEKYSWPHMRAERFLTPQIGQRFYDPQGCKKLDETNTMVAAGDMSIDRIAEIRVRDGSVWSPPLEPYIDAALFNQFDSDTDERSWPIRCWRIAEGNNVEFWPIPDQDGDESTLENMVKMIGVRDLAPFVDENDEADLDEQLIVLFAAARLAPDKDRKDKLALAQDRLVDVRGNAVPRRKVKLFSRDQPQGRIMRGPPTVYYRTTT